MDSIKKCSEICNYLQGKVGVNYRCKVLKLRETYKLAFILMCNYIFLVFGQCPVYHFFSSMYIPLKPPHAAATKRSGIPAVTPSAFSFLAVIILRCPPFGNSIYKLLWGIASETN